MSMRTWVSRYVWTMKQHLLTALLALLIFLPARAQGGFSDSLRISLLTCSAGPDAYERFGHAGLRIEDLRNPQVDVTFHYGVFSFNAPHFIYRFVKGETDYQLGAIPTRYFIEEYRERGLGMIQQQLRLDSAQSQEVLQRLLINYRPENRTYRYSYFFDNCSTRPYHLLNAATNGVIKYDSIWVNAIPLREMVQECTGRDNWLDFGIALAVAGRADRTTTYEEQLFLPDYLSKALNHATIPVQIDSNTVALPLVLNQTTLLEMQPRVAAEIAAKDAISPITVFTIVLIVGLLLTMLEWRQRRFARKPMPRALDIVTDSYDTLLFLFLGITGCIVWFLNFLSLHPAVDHNLNCFWLLPTHVVIAVLLWLKRMHKVCRIYFGITFAAVFVYILLNWTGRQYCPPAFLLILCNILVRCFMRMTRNDKPQD